MNQFTLPEIELVVQTMAEVAIENEAYFSDLDSAAGDGDFGASLATGFRKMQDQRDLLDRTDIGSFLLAVSRVIASSVGGCSGPIWGTAFMKAGIASRGKASLTLDDLVAMHRAAVDGIKKRGGAEPGDKTLLDALIPAGERLQLRAAEGREDLLEAFEDATQAAAAAVEHTRGWAARRGRQSFTGERSRGTLDPGIVAVSAMMQAVGKALRETSGASR